MRFDYTKGKDARYMVSIYGETIEDKYYYHYHKEAKAMFEQMKKHGFEKGTALSIYDIKQDIRKAFIKF